MCWSYDDLIPELGDQYMDIVHNKVTPIYSVSMHVLTFDMHIFSHSQVIYCYINMTTMYHHIVLICLKYKIDHFTIPSVLLIGALVFEF